MNASDYVKIVKNDNIKEVTNMNISSHDSSRHCLYCFKEVESSSRTQCQNYTVIENVSYLVTSSACERIMSR